MHGEHPQFFKFKSILLFIVYSLVFFGFVNAQSTAEFQNIACSQHENFERFDEARECVKSVLSNSKDSLEISAAYTILARIEDEFFDYEKADSAYHLAIKHFPKKQYTSELHIDLLLEIGNFHKAYYERDTSNSYLKNALSLTKRNDKKLEALFSLATNFWFQELPDSNESYLTKAKALLNSQDSILAGKYYHFLGQHFYDISDYVNCVPALTLAINTLKNTSYKKELADIYFLLGDAYSEAQNQARAIYLYKIALNLYENSAKEEVINTKNTLGWAYYNLRKADSSYVYLKSALRDYSILSPNSPIRAYQIGNLGLVYELMDSNELAISYSLQAIDLFKVLGYIPGIAEANNNLGKVYFKQKRYELSKEHFEEGKRIADDEWYEPFELMNAKLGLSKIAEVENQPLLAFQYLKEATIIKDSLFNLRLATTLLADEMNTSQQMAESKMQSLEREKMENEVALRKSRYALVAITLTLLIVIGSSIAISISWKQRQNAIQRQTEILSINQEIIRMISHDFRGPMNNIRSLMELIRDESMSIQEFNEVSEIIYKQTCDISLMFETFVGWALSQSNNYIPKTEKTDWDENVQGVISLLNPLATIKYIEIHYRKDDNYILNTDRIASQLVLRNIISNAIKYSHENSVIEVNVSSSANYLITEIVDFGVGMDAERMKELFSDEIDSKKGTHNEIGSGLGLRMAMKFAELNGGRIEVQSQVGSGSKFTYYLPI